MTAVALTAERDLALELRALLLALDPARWSDDEDYQRQLDSLRGRLAELLDATSDPLAALEVAYLELSEWSPVSEADWQAFRKELQPVYESLATELGQADVHVPSLRPTNYTRSIFHVFSALSVVVLIEALPMKWLTPLAALMAASAWTMELTRRYSPTWNRVLMGVFSRVAHPHEAHRINSSTWYVTALLLLSLVGEPMVPAVAVAILGLSDPAAALVGRRFGSIKLVNGRSLQGSAAFLVVGAAIAYAVISLFHPEWMGWRGGVIALAAAMPATLAELFARRVDDNFAIPVTAAGGALIALWLL